MVRIDSYSGNFNYLNSKDRSTIVRIYLPDDAPENVLDESWPEGDEPDTDLPPSEMVELFSKRLATYLINSARPRKERLIAWCRANAARLDREWAETKIAALRKEIVSAEKQIKRLELDYLCDVRAVRRRSILPQLRGLVAILDTPFPLVILRGLC